jgi:PAS domain S-box-containing protein
VDLVNAAIWRSIQTLEPFQCEYRVQVPGKALKWLWAKSVPERLPGGGVLFHGFNTDITERKLLEGAFHESEERFAKVFTTSDDPIGIFRQSDSVCIDANPAFCAQLGRSREELVGHPADFQIFTDESVGREFFQILRSQRSVTNMEGQFRASSGALGVCLASAYLVDIRGETCILFYAKDITALKQAEASLRESEERFNRAFRASPIGINLFRLADGRSIDVNDAYHTLTGYAREEIVGHSAAELNLFTNPQERDAWFRTLQAQGFLRNVETAIRTRSGEIRHSLFSIETLELRGEKVALVLLVDITAQKHAEAMLLAANEILEKRVSQRTAELDHTNAALQQALRARDEFMAAMSHELRTPLTGILGIAESLEFGLGGSLTEKQQQSVAGIRKNGLRLLELIEDVLSYAALLSGRVQLEPWQFSLTSACEKSLGVVQPKAGAKQQRVTFLSAPANILLNGDERCVRQILEHLLDNAVKFTPNGGQIQLALTGQAAEKQVVISLSDSGIGIKAEDLPRLFRPFVQLDSRLARVYEGTGLGLALVKELAELHGGRVEVESVFAKGSTFRVILPWDGQALAENPEKQTKTLPPAAQPGDEPLGLPLLPRGLVDDLVTATATADFDRLMDLLDQAAGYAPAWAAKLRTLAANYQYDTLMDQLRPAADAHAPG